MLCQALVHEIVASSPCTGGCKLPNHVQVDDLEAALRAARAADHAVEVQSAESRARSLQASLSRKEDTIRELRERMEQACR